MSTFSLTQYKNGLLDFLKRRRDKDASRVWLRGRDLNPRPSGYEPDELPGCSTPRLEEINIMERIVKSNVKMIT
jgi:hypothetical protein